MRAGMFFSSRPGDAEEVGERSGATRLRFERRASNRGFEWPHTERRDRDVHPHPHAMYGRRRDDALELPCHSPLCLGVKRALDLVLAAVTLIVISPLFVVIAIALKCTSRGPVLFRQVRVGRHHQHFTVLKFRTMRDGTYDALLSDESRWARHAANGFKHHSPDEVTPLGRWLRMTSLDELPQLWNVVRGDMSIVGVRPLVPLELGARPRRSQGMYGVLRPGVTGLWQVSGRSHTTTDERIELDERYARTWSIGRDISILLRTPLAVLRAEGAR